jgi:hypothetical protein
MCMCMHAYMRSAAERRGGGPGIGLIGFFFLLLPARLLEEVGDAISEGDLGASEVGQVDNHQHVLHVVAADGTGNEERWRAREAKEAYRRRNIDK